MNKMAFCFLTECKYFCLFFKTSRFIILFTYRTLESNAANYDFPLFYVFKNGIAPVFEQDVCLLFFLNLALSRCVFMNDMTIAFKTVMKTLGQCPVSIRPSSNVMAQANKS